MYGLTLYGKESYLRNNSRSDYALFFFKTWHTTHTLHIIISYVQFCAVMCRYVQLCAVMCRYVQLCAVMCSYVQLSVV